MKKNVQLIVLGGLAFLVMTAYWLFSAGQSGPGFPLDDAWIHQTYARNIALRGEWAFVAGQPSAGLTAPLWGLLLVPGYWLGAAPHLWSGLIGWLTLWGIGGVGHLAAKKIFPDSQWIPMLFGVVLIFEWHLVWAALSGMETLLFSLMVTAVLVSIIKGAIDSTKQWVWLASLIGLSIWLRPEGITLIAPVGLAIWLSRKAMPEKIKDSLAVGGTVGLFFSAYLLFNRWLAGSWWPNTFYAKQAEYAELLARPVLERIAALLSLPLVGVGLVLVPGFVYLIWNALRNRHWQRLLVVAWIVGFIGLYVLRLPVTYQHGRYLIPMMAIFLFVSLVGAVEMVEAIKSDKAQNLTRFSYILFGGGVLFAFLGLAAKNYATDVAIINTEMVEAALWVDQNLPQDARIAAHDIGALGYFAERELVDLAGLISPDVIPFIRDEARLADFMTAEGVEYLITFPNWYPQLSTLGQEIYRTTGEVSPRNGGENMTIYRWISP